MFTGAMLLVTIFSALSLGIFAGWAALAAVLHLFFATKTATQAKAVPQRAVTATVVNIPASHTA